MKKITILLTQPTKRLIQHQYSHILLILLGLIPERNSNLVNASSSQFLDPEAVSRSSKSILKDLLLVDNKNKYQYSFSIKSIEFGNTSVSQGGNSDKACFVSKKIPFNGLPLGIKCIISEKKSNLDLGLSNFQLKKPISYEISISNVEVPISESDWNPILPHGTNFVDSEVLFFDRQSLEAKTRFVFSQEKIQIYKDGFSMPRSSYSLKDNRVILSELDINSVYVCDYSVNLGLYGYDNLDLIKSKLVKESIQPYYDQNGQGEKFTSTDYLGKVTLKTIPYINFELSNLAIYSAISGTIFPSQYRGYCPVKVKMSDGLQAINLTNYTTAAEMPSFPNSSGTFFIQNGKEIVFNQLVTEPFTVEYEYLNLSTRFRVILRKNIKSIIYSGALDSLVVKAKTKNYDQYFDKLNKSLSRSIS